MSVTPGIRMKTPAHPGGFAKHEIIEPHGLSVTDAARILGVTCPALSALFNVSMDTLMRMRNNYDIAAARK